MDNKGLPEIFVAVPVCSEHGPYLHLANSEDALRRQYAMRVDFRPCLHAEQRILDLWSLALHTLTEGYRVRDAASPYYMHKPPVRRVSRVQ